MHCLQVGLKFTFGWDEVKMYNSYTFHNYGLFIDGACALVICMSRISLVQLAGYNVTGGHA